MINEKECVNGITTLKVRISEAGRLVSEGKFQEAIKLCKGLLDDYPDLKELYSIICDLYLKTGRTDIPRQWIINSVKYDESFNKTFVDVAAKLYAENRFKEALDVLSSVVEGCPSNEEAWNDLGVVQLALDGHSMAEQSFKHALAINRHYEEAIINLTVLYLSTGRNDFALNTARLLFEKGSVASAKTFRIIGDVFSLEMPDEAEKLYARALSLSVPSSTHKILINL